MVARPGAAERLQRAENRQRHRETHVAQGDDLVERSQSAPGPPARPISDQRSKTRGVVRKIRFEEQLPGGRRCR